MKQGIVKQLLLPVCLLAASVLLTWSSGITATEVHTWTDENGVIHFSDAPSSSGESDTIEVEDIYKPGTTDATDTGEQPDSVAAEPGHAESPSSAAQERRDKMAKDREERREKEAITDKLCALHKDRLERVEPARRVMYTDDNGELVRMDDDDRMGLIAESKEFISENCD